MTTHINEGHQFVNYEIKTVHDSLYCTAGKNLRFFKKVLGF